MEILTDYDNEVYKTQVMNSPEGSLFKQWASPLNRLQREKGEISVMDIWQTSTQCIEKLYQAGGNKIDEIPFIYTSLIKECSIIKQGKNTINRTRAEAEASAQLIMTVTATRSLNYIQPGHEEDPVSENDGVVLKIMNEIGETAFDKYAELFFSQKTNIYGEKIVIDSYNPFTAKDANTTPTLQKEARRKKILTTLFDKTRGLEQLFGSSDYENLKLCFETICNDDTLLTQFEMKKTQRQHLGHKPQNGTQHHRYLRKQKKHQHPHAPNQHNHWRKQQQPLPHSPPPLQRQPHRFRHHHRQL